MNIFIVGSNIDINKSDAFKTVTESIGFALGKTLHNIVLCSAYDGSADFYILKGLAKSNSGEVKNNVIVHRPANKEIKDQWKKAKEIFKINSIDEISHAGIDILDSNSRSLAFLYCQIKAIEISDVVIFIGGSLSGSARFISTIAMQQKLLIIPLRFFEGVGEYLFNKLEGDLRSYYSSSLIEKLSDPDEISVAITELIEYKKEIKKRTDIRVFLSYSWRRSDLADCVEAILRRRSNVTLFRDEKDIKQAESINETIELEIKDKSDIFMALWCKDYIESPYCYDELMMWLRSRGKSNLYLLRFDKTRPVWPELRIDKNNRSEFNALWPEVGETREQIELALNKLIDSNF